MGMITLNSIELDYAISPHAWATRLWSWPGVVWLDSGRPACVTGRYDILAAQPERVMRVDGRGCITVQEAQGLRSVNDAEAELRAWLRMPVSGAEGWPFRTGLLGFWGYDYGLAQVSLPSQHGDNAWPQLQVGWHAWAIVIDHVLQRSCLIGDARILSGIHQKLLHATAQLAPQFAPLGEIKADLDEIQYLKKFAQVQQYLRNGDIYQANLAMRFAVAAAGHPWDAYQCLRQLSPAPYSAYLGGEDNCAVLSVSPECFLRLENNVLTTRPIKGTRPRYADQADDARVAQALLQSPKDRAENVMIVDLLRNDLSKVCEPHSVTVPALFQLETYSNVHHLVSEVRGQLREQLDALDVIRACLPSGSVTGAPKYRAMQIIDALENHRRGVYCGAIGYISQHGAMQLSVAIRTATMARGHFEFWAGSGLVADSIGEDEYGEIITKAKHALVLMGA
jgi:para-aminobenzoate synthetase component I